MSKYTLHKVTELPSNLEPDAIYYIKVGDKYKQVVTDSSGEPITPQLLWKDIDNTPDTITQEERTKLSNIEAEANKYIHPDTHPASIIVQNANNRFVTDVEKNTWNNKADIEDIPTSNSELDNDEGYISEVDWNEVDNKPTSFPPTNHTHPASDINSGIFPFIRLPISQEEVTNWNTAYSWGDHSTEGYIKSYVDTQYTNGVGLDLTNNTFSVIFGTTAGTVAQGNDSRINNGQTAYSWGNHANEDYLKTISWNEIQEKPSLNISNWNTAYNKKVNSLSVTGDSNKTITLTLQDGTTITGSFLDDNTVEFPDDVLNTLTFNDGNDGVLRAITSEGEIIDVSLDGRYALLTHVHTWNEIENKPSTFPPSNHNHSASDVTSGVFSYSRLPISLSNVNNWNTAHGWGDHSIQGYLKTISWGEIEEKPELNINNWNQAYEWGNHENAGYIKDGIPNTALNDYVPTDRGYLRNLIRSYYQRVVADGGVIKAPISVSDLLTVEGNSGNIIKHIEVVDGIVEHIELGFIENQDLPILYTSDIINDLRYITENGLLEHISEEDINSWNEAHNWGDHAEEGYIKSFTDTTYLPGTGLDLTDNTFSVKYGTTSGTAAQGNDSRINNGQTAFLWGNHSTEGYLKSISWEQVDDKPTLNIANWNSAFSWGNHATQGYLKTVSWGDLTDKPDLAPSNAEENVQSDWNETVISDDSFIRNKPTNLSDFNNDENYITDVSWEEVNDKPSTFPPASHQHTWNQIQNKPTEFSPEAHTHTWEQVTGKPTLNLSNWNTAYNKKVNSISVTGDSNKTITLTLQDGNTLTATFLDDNTIEFPDDVLNTLSFDGGVLRAVTSEGAIIDVSLDGRYSLIGHEHSWTEITNKPTSFPPSTHSHSWTQITDKPTVFPPATHLHDWNSITDKPTTFPPSNHSHSWGEITGKPTEFPSESHNHSTSEITSGVFSFARLPITQTNVDNWNQAYNWGNHASEGYLKTISWTDIQEKPDLNIENWNTAFGWGDHSQAGYIKEAIPHSALNDYVSVDILGLQGLVASFYDRVVADDGIIKAPLSAEDFVTEEGNAGNIIKNIEIVEGKVEYIELGFIQSKDLPLIPTSHLYNDLKFVTETGLYEYIEQDDIDNWNEAHSWGDHSDENYLKSVSWGDVMGKPTSFPPATHSHSWAQITGKPDLDNYQSWNLRTNGTQRTGIASGGVLDLIGGSNVSLSYASGGRVTINATNTNTTYLAGTGLSLSGTTFNVTNPFNPSGTYSGLRAQATTKADVGLSNTPNWSGGTSTSLGTSNTVIPSQGAVKSYVDSGLSGKANTSGTYSGLRAQATTKADVGLGSVDNYSRTHYDGRYISKSINTSFTGEYPITVNVNGTLYTHAGVTITGSTQTIKAFDFTATSDERLKENITEYIPDKLKTSYKNFNFIGNNQDRVGVLAQELEQCHPEFVRTNEEGTKSVSYIDLHSAEIAYLKSQNEAKDKKIASLEERIAKLEKLLL